MNKQYKPISINTIEIKLDDNLIELTEILAKNAHDIWALKRMDEGWKYGEKRCDIEKTNPCLVHYEDLPETEKEYDRNTAMGTIKAMIALGYSIEKFKN